MKQRIILGSQSEGRKKMLEEMGIEFKVMAPNIDEKAIRLKDTKELVLAIARAKADALRPQISEPAILITSDQVIICRDEVREKPESKREAKEFLESYNTYPAQTVTAVVVTNLVTGKQAKKVDMAKVYFYPFSQDEINNIIAKREVFNLAGAFKVDGEEWEGHVKKIEGMKDSVVGLPKDITMRLIHAVEE